MTTALLTTRNDLGTTPDLMSAVRLEEAFAHAIIAGRLGEIDRRELPPSCSRIRPVPDFHA